MDKIYRGVLIRKTPFGRWETPGSTWGDGPGEHHTFKTLTAAKAFVEREWVRRKMPLVPAPRIDEVYIEAANRQR